jgi:hypothetical protein
LKSVFTIVAACLLPALAVSAEERPPPDLPPAVRAYLEALEKRVRELEQRAPKDQPAQPGQPATPAAPKPPAELPAGVKTVRGTRLEVGGYAEVRITNFANSVGDRLTDSRLDFQVARFRPRLMYHLDRHWQADFQLNANTRGTGATSVNMRDMFVEYHNAGYRMRLGQQKVPFGFHTYVEGDEDRAALERARVFNILIPDERDLGFVASTNPHSTRAARFAAGVVNGNGINRTDNNTDKNFAATARTPVGAYNTVGASVYSGTFSPSGSAGPKHTRKAVGVDHQLALRRFQTQFEWLLGKDLGKTVTGGYGQLEYRFGGPGNLFARHDWYDPGFGPGQDYFRRSILGWYKDLNRNLRITAEYDWVRNSATSVEIDDTYGVEVQARF